MKLLIAQLPIVWEKPQENLAAFLKHLEASEVTPGTVVILPEMFPTGFTENLPEASLPEGSEWERVLREEADKRQIGFFVGVARRNAEGVVTNDALLVTGEGVEAVYRKNRLVPWTGEDRVAERGREILVVEYEGVRWCPLICFDLRFPELFRMALSLGAEVFVVMANWPDPRRHHWRLLLQARAIENQAVVVGVNRVGTDPRFVYAGDSLVFGPSGECLFDAGDRSGLFPVTFDPEDLRNWREAFPAVTGYLQDPGLRPEGIELRYHRATTGDL